MKENNKKMLFTENLDFSFCEKWPVILRWILVLPVIFISLGTCYIIINFIFDCIANIVQSSDSDQGSFAIRLFIKYALIWFLVSQLAIGLIPLKNKYIGNVIVIVIYLLLVIYCYYNIFDLLLNKFYSDKIQFVFISAGGLIGCLFTFIAIYKSKKELLKKDNIV